jgi:hypothetical protein
MAIQVKILQVLVATFQQMGEVEDKISLLLFPGRKNNTPRSRYPKENKFI